MESILANIRTRLASLADEQTRIAGERFFKEEVHMHGIKTPVITAIANDFYRQVRHFPKDELYAICEELWKSQNYEECIIACRWSDMLHKQFTPEDFVIFERWVQLYITNWATCDTFCNHAMGTFVTMYPEYVKKVMSWTQSQKRWVKRASAVTFIIPARNGLFHTEIFQIADALLHDPDDMVQKGYGWMLKATSQSDQQAVFEYVMKHKATMPRTALRYAIEKMPPHLKAEAMKKA